jgi:hypothetical protein
MRLTGRLHHSTPAVCIIISTNIDSGQIKTNTPRPIPGSRWAFKVERSMTVVPIDVMRFQSVTSVTNP